MAGQSMTIKHTDNLSIKNNITKVGGGKGAITGVGFTDVGGAISVRNNDFGGAPSSYTRDSVADAPGIDACGNTTAVGTNRPIACAVPDPNIPDTTPPPNGNNNPSSGQPSSGSTGTGSSTSQDLSAGTPTDNTQNDSSVKSINNVAEKPIFKIKDTSFRVGHLVGILFILIAVMGGGYYLIKHKKQLQEDELLNQVPVTIFKP